MDELTTVSARDAMSNGLMGLLKPVVEDLDERVLAVRQSQLELRQSIDSLAIDLKQISEVQQEQSTIIELEPYLKKLNNARRRIVLVNNILQNVQERVGKLHHSVSKETARRKALLDPPTAGPPI